MNLINQDKQQFKEASNILIYSLLFTDNLPMIINSLFNLFKI